MYDKAINSDEEDGMGFSGLVPSKREKDQEALHLFYQGKYNELLFAVCRKFPGESRHQTALRYIREAEKQSSADTACKQS